MAKKVEGYIKLQILQLHHKDSACSSPVKEGVQPEVRFSSAEQDKSG